jgi:hypothetical protein
MVVLKHRDKELYIMSVNWVDGEVSFTEDIALAKPYKNDWFADAEKSQLTCYAAKPYEKGGLKGEYVSEIPEMIVYYT